MDAAFLFEPDGYLIDGPKLMGRQSAGNGFLRASVAANPGGSLAAYTPQQSSFEAFSQAVRALDATVSADWIPAARLDLLARAGTLYRPDSALSIPAATRLREGPAAYSLCGVTHTLCTDGALRQLSDLLTTPVMPWDALICTSQAALTLVREIMERQADFLRWQLGQPVALPGLQLPVIPLGVHAADFESDPQARAQARTRFGLVEDEVVALFAGRLSFSGKAHPIAMLRGLQEAHARTGRKVTLIQAGSFFNEQIAALYRQAAARYAPDIRCLYVDGRDFADYGASWRAADLFVSMTDTIRETFGLTPVEAMAAGLPAVVTDWNGYKDTVRDGLDGFRIRTWAPAQSADDAAAREYETRSGNLDSYLVRIGGAVAVDQGQLNDRLAALVADPDMRARMGGAGRERVHREFDWRIIYDRYRTLWAELGAIRRSLAASPEWAARLAAAPRHHPANSDPFALFAHYPTAAITAGSRVRAARNGLSYQRLKGEPLFAFSRARSEATAALLADAAEPAAIATLAVRSGLDEVALAEAAARLAKMGVVEIDPD